jgi:hypothetical protein
MNTFAHMHKMIRTLITSVDLSFAGELGVGDFGEDGVVLV